MQTRTSVDEHGKLKDEQIMRIGFRDGLIRDTIIAIAGALTITHAAHNHAYLLLVPVVTFVLGWKYLANDEMITAIGRYIRDNKNLVGTGWEHDHSEDKHRASRKSISLMVDIITFCVSGLSALIAYWLAPDSHSTIYISVSIVEALLTILLTQQFVMYSGINPKGALSELSRRFNRLASHHEYRSMARSRRGRDIQDTTARARLGEGRQNR